MHVYLSSSSQLLCKFCSKPIPISTLIAAPPSSPDLSQRYHLPCYHPPRLLSISEVSFETALSSTHLATVRIWLSQQRTHRECDSGLSVSADLRRIMLMVMEFLSTKDVELRIARVSKAMLRASRDNEFWKGRFVLETDPLHTVGTAAYREMMIEKTVRGCWHCGAIVPKTANERFHTKQPLCLKCMKHPECKTVNLDSYLITHQLDASLVDYLSFPTFYVKKSRTAYVGLILPGLTSYAERRKSLLLSLLSHRGVPSNVISGLQEISMKSYYLETHSCYPYDCLPQFCGRDERYEQIERNVNNVLKYWSVAEGIGPSSDQ